MSVTRSRPEIVQAIETAGVVAVVRLKDATSGRAVAHALAHGGVTAIEITMTVPGAVGLIDDLSAWAPPHILIGAGTVLDVATAREVMDAGARFIVSPVFKRELIEACHAAGLPAIPGCFSPTEIVSAWEAGADLVKVFPATALGPAFFRDMRGPLPHVRMMPTGGVTRENAGEWIRAGAVAIGVGTALVDQALVAQGRFEAIADNARLFVQTVQQARRTSPTEHTEKSNLDELVERTDYREKSLLGDLGGLGGETGGARR